MRPQDIRPGEGPVGGGGEDQGRKVLPADLSPRALSLPKALIWPFSC